MATCAGAGEPRLAGCCFRLVALDEASQATEPAALVALLRGAQCAVMAGDPKQAGRRGAGRGGRAGGAGGRAERAGGGGARHGVPRRGQAPNPPPTHALTTSNNDLHTRAASRTAAAHGGVPLRC